jgi:hypothetical protein
MVLIALRELVVVVRHQVDIRVHNEPHGILRVHYVLTRLVMVRAVAIKT